MGARSAQAAGRAGSPLNQPKTEREILLEMILHELGVDEKNLAEQVWDQVGMDSNTHPDTLVLLKRDKMEELVALIKAALPTVRKNAEQAALHKAAEEAARAVVAAAEQVVRDKAHEDRFMQEIAHPEQHGLAPQGKTQPVRGVLHVTLDPKAVVALVEAVKANGRPNPFGLKDLLNKGIKAECVLMLNKLGVDVTNRSECEMDIPKALGESVFRIPTDPAAFMITVEFPGRGAEIHQVISEHPPQTIAPVAKFACEVSLSTTQSRPLSHTLVANFAGLQRDVRDAVLSFLRTAGIATSRGGWRPESTYATGDVSSTSRLDVSSDLLLFPAARFVQTLNGSGFKQRLRDDIALGESRFLRCSRMSGYNATGEAQFEVVFIPCRVFYNSGMSSKQKAENFSLRREGGAAPSWRPWVLQALEQERRETEQEGIQAEYEARLQRDREAEEAQDVQLAMEWEASENARLRQEEEAANAQLLIIQAGWQKEAEQRAAERKQAEALQRSGAQELINTETRKEVERQAEIRRVKQKAIEKARKEAALQSLLRGRAQEKALLMAQVFASLRKRAGVYKQAGVAGARSRERRLKAVVFDGWYNTLKRVAQAGELEAMHREDCPSTGAVGEAEWSAVVGVNAPAMVSEPVEPLAEGQEGNRVTTGIAGQPPSNSLLAGEVSAQRSGSTTESQEGLMHDAGPGVTPAVGVGADHGSNVSSSPAFLTEDRSDADSDAPAPTGAKTAPASSKAGTRPARKTSTKPDMSKTGGKKL